MVYYIIDNLRLNDISFTISRRMNTKRAKIICDTSVWYDITYKSYADLQERGYDLYATGLNLIELAKSPRLISDFEKIKVAIQNLFRFSYCILPRNPYEWIMDIYYIPEPEYIRIHPTIYDAKEFLQAIAQGETIGDLKKPELERKILAMKKELKNLTNDVIELLRMTRNQSNNATVDTQSDEIYKELVTKICLKNYLSEPIPFMQSFNWENIGLLLSVLKTYFTELDNSNKKMEPNDWYDILNFSYVQPTELYITSEKTSQFIKTIRKNHQLTMRILNMKSFE